MTFVLTWNPARWSWDEDDYERDVQSTARGHAVRGRWSVGGRRTGIEPGDRALLLRQHSERGIVAGGHFATDIIWDEHWDGSQRQTTYADVAWDVVIDPTDRLPVEILKDRVPGVAWDRLQGSGVAVPPPSDVDLEAAWSQHIGGMAFHSPEEVTGGTFAEGAVTRVEVNRYERDGAARLACIARWGAARAVCGLDFETLYGESAGASFMCTL